MLVVKYLGKKLQRFYFLKTKVKSDWKIKIDYNFITFCSCLVALLLFCFGSTFTFNWKADFFKIWKLDDYRHQHYGKLRQISSTGFPFSQNQFYSFLQFCQNC